MKGSCFCSWICIVLHYCCVEFHLETFAAFTVDLLVYPLDTLKTRFQSPDYKKIYYNVSQTAVNRKALFRGLYQGVGSVILITIPSSGAFFTTYEAVKSGLSKANPIWSGSLLIPQPFIHSAASATAELMIRRPAQPTSKASTAFQPSITIQALKQLTALAARNLPFTAMQFPMFERLKESIKQYRQKSGAYTGSLMETGLTTAISAGSAGSIAAIITTPVDVVKTRIMLSAAGEDSEAEAKKQGVTRKSSLTVAKEIMAESGVKGLFRGGTLRAAWTALGSGLYLGVYESGRVWLGGQHKPNDGPI
ncbi:mitochondrial carrier [Acephala macrosclerotiorum]|nr:mitochondrial carrier [Acephala macrosclerotiorum]